MLSFKSFKAYFDKLDEWSASIDPKLWLATNLSSKNRLYFKNLLIQNKLLVNSHTTLSELESEVLVESSLLRLFKITLTAVKTFFRLMEARFLIPAQFDSSNLVVFKTFNLENSVSGDQFNDLYFGRLPEVFQASGRNVVFLIDPLTPLRSRVFGPSRIQVASIYSYLSLSKLISNYLHFILITIRNSGENRLLSSELYSGGTFQSFLYFECFKSFCEKINPKVIFYTFENNPWERMLLLAKNKIRTVAVQHVPATPSAVHYFQDKVSNVHSVPDYILSLGPESSKQLREVFNYSDKRVIDGAGFKYRFITSEKPRSIRKVKKWLIALGASDSKFLAEYFVRNSDKFFELGIEISFRFHPAFGEKAMGLVIPSSIRISKTSLADDLREAEAVFYHGSGVALEALNFGIPLVYLFPKDELRSNDLLYEFDSTKIRLHDQSEPSVVVDALQKLISDNFEEKQKVGIEYLNRLIRKFDFIRDAEWAEYILKELTTDDFKGSSS